MSNKKDVDLLFAPRPQGIKYSSVDTRYSSLHGFMGDAEVNEVNFAPSMMPGEVPNDWNAMNIKSGQNKTDLPSAWGMNPDKGLQKIGSAVFTPENIIAGWRRNKGEPIG